MSLVLPKLFINNPVIKRQSSIKFLGILLDENLSWKEHLKLTGITGNHKLYYANADFKLPLESSNLEQPSRKYEKRISIVFSF